MSIENEPVHLLPTFLRFTHLALLLACTLASGLIACGGGESDAPTVYPSKTISGTVVLNGAVKSNALVHITCSNGNGGVRNYYATTDATGAYRKSIDTASAPCVVDAYANTDTTYLFGFAARLDAAEITANISPLTDTMLIYMLGTRSFAQSLASAKGLATLQASISQGKDVAAWTQLRQQLVTDTYFTASTDVAAMAKDPATDVIQVTSGVAPPGHYALLQKLYTSGLRTRNAMQVLLYGQASSQYEVLDGSNGAEVADLVSGLVWQRCVRGMTWDGTTCTGTPGVYLWTEVAGLVAGAAASPVPKASAWRLPSKAELNTLARLGSTVIDPIWFPASPGYWTWTGESPCVVNGVHYPAIVVNLQGFESGCGEDADQLHVRLVR